MPEKFCFLNIADTSNLSALLKFLKNSDTPLISVKLQNSGYIYVSKVCGDL